jgi:hypothetical protein
MFASLSAWRALLLGTFYTSNHSIRTILQPNAQPPILRRWGRDMCRVATETMQIKTLHSGDLDIEKGVPTLIFANHPCTLSSWFFIDFLYRYFGNDIVVVMRDDQPFPLNHGVNQSNFSLAIPRDDGPQARRIIQEHFEQHRGEPCIYVVIADGRRWTEERYREQLAYFEKRRPNEDYSWTKHSLKWRAGGTWLPLQAFREQYQTFQVYEFLNTFNRPTLGTTGFFQGPAVVEHLLDAHWEYRLTPIEPREIPVDHEEFRHWFEKRCQEANHWLGRKRKHKRF